MDVILALTIGLLVYACYEAAQSVKQKERLEMKRHVNCGFYYDHTWEDHDE